MNTLGARVIDRRSKTGKALASWRADLVADLGGLDRVSTQQLALVDLAVRTKLMLDSIDAWLLTQPSLVNARKHALLPVVRERATLAAGFQTLMKDLGLDRKDGAEDPAKQLLAMQPSLPRMPATRALAPATASTSAAPKRSRCAWRSRPSKARTRPKSR